MFVKADTAVVVKQELNISKLEPKKDANTLFTPLLM